MFRVRRMIIWAVLFLMPGCMARGDGEVALTLEERQKVTELVLAVAEDPEETVKSAHDELWTILKKHGSPSGKQISRLKPRLLMIGEGHRLFWLDAREALKSHRMVKSPDRARWEEGLARDGWFSLQQQARFDEIMKQVMTEDPIPSNHGVEVSLSSTMVDEIMKSWDERELERSVAYLLTPSN
ncbi:MAG: hypothetical protein HY283_10070 [Nitrospirae bacterium]|nr:hypothetical protein [Nitrospirota bacterium]